MNLTVDPSKRFDLTVRYPKDGTSSTTNVNHAELIANLQMHRVPMLTCFQRRGVVQMSGGPQLIWKPAEADTMTVTVRDRSAETPWGVGLTTPVTRTVTISAFCPVCGERRGEPQGRNQCDDGAYYWVQVWTNPCGHVDMYTAVLAEAAQS